LFPGQFMYLGVDPWEIGVIVPYRAQVRLIRKMLKLANLEGIEVGSVEQFQGQVRGKWRFRMIRALILVTFTLGTKSDHLCHNSEQLGIYP
jgi:AAA domain